MLELHQERFRGVKLLMGVQHISQRGEKGDTNRKLSFMTIFCYFGRVIPNIHVNLDVSF